MKAYVFPGQGAQFTGMGKDLYEKSSLAKEMFEKANEILGFRITDIMFEGTTEELKLLSFCIRLFWLLLWEIPSSPIWLQDIRLESFRLW